MPDTNSDVTDIEIPDLDKFFFTSQLIDSIRDTAMFMLRRNVVPSDTALTSMRAQYEQLRSQFSKILPPEVAETAEHASPALTEHSDLTEILFACAQTAKWLDSLLAIKPFKIAHQVNNDEMRRRMEGLLAASDRDGVTGNYL